MKGCSAPSQVERGIDLLGGALAEPQNLAQRVAGGRGIQHPRGRQLGRRLEQAGDDQGQRQIATALRRPARQHGVERDAACRAQRGEHMAVRQRADDFHRRGGRQEFVAAQHGAELFNALGGPAGQIGQGSVPGLAGLAVTLTQQDGRRRAAVRDDSHVHEPIEALSAGVFNQKLPIYMTTLSISIRLFSGLTQNVVKVRLNSADPRFSLCAPTNYFWLFRGDIKRSVSCLRSNFARNAVPATTDSDLAARLRRAGVVIFGKTTLPRSSELCLQAGTVSLATSKLYTRAVLPPAILACSSSGTPARIFRDWGNVDSLCGSSEPHIMLSTPTTSRRRIPMAS